MSVGRGGLTKTEHDSEAVKLAAPPALSWAAVMHFHLPGVGDYKEVITDFKLFGFRSLFNWTLL